MKSYNNNSRRSRGKAFGISHAPNKQKQEKEISFMGILNRKAVFVLLTMILVLALAGSALATGGALSTFTATYPGTNYSCSLCHTSAPATNPYGADLTLPVSAAKLAAIENVDSDGDGFTNIVEINAGTLPGNAASKPATPPPPPPPPPPGGASVTITAPNGGEAVPSGAPYNITFNAPAEVTSVKVKFSVDGGLTWLPASGTPGTGSFAWNVPSPPANKTNVLVRVIGYDASNAKVGADKSDAAFSIETVSITSPTGGTCSKGLPFNVTWTTNGTKAPVSSSKVFYSFNGGSTWKLASGTGTLSNFSWDVPSPAGMKNNARIKVVLKDSGGRKVGLAVSEVFSVQ